MIDALPADLWPRIISTVFLIVFIVVVRMFAHYVLLPRSDVPRGSLPSWKANVRSILGFLLVIGLLFIWAPQLKAFAFSVVAFGVAIVIATKEILACWIGSFYRLGTKAFRIGDIVTVLNMTGEVTDKTALAFTMQQMDDQTSAYTGRAITFPNSLLLTNNVANHSAQGCVRAEVAVPLAEDENWRDVERQLLVSAQEEADRYARQIEAAVKRLSEATAVEQVAFAPRAHLRLTDPAKIEMVLHFFVPVRERAAAEQRLLRRLLDWREERKKPAEATS